MKLLKFLLIFSIISTLAGCSNSNTQENKTENVKDSQMDASDSTLAVPPENPSKIIYLRRWEYGLDVETEDTETIDSIMTILRSMTLGEETNIATEDYTDIVILEYPDKKISYEFEYNSYVSEDGKRLFVKNGLSELRIWLDSIVPQE